MFKQKLTILLCLFGMFLPVSSALAGTISSSHKYAWSNNAGYINFENVIVGDSALSGYAWSANKGFIKFDPALGGVVNDGAGNISGSAWGEQLGWIDFSGVHIDGNGIFSGTASGTLVGTITFDCPNYCDVRTDWRAPPPPASSQGGGGGSNSGSSSGGSRAPAPIKAPATAVIPAPEHVIGLTDFNDMMVNWGITTCGNTADLDSDCSVGILDFNLVMVNWGG